jgi:hypothetical protein
LRAANAARPAGRIRRVSINTGMRPRLRALQWLLGRRGVNRMVYLAPSVRLRLPSIQP